MRERHAFIHRIRVGHAPTRDGGYAPHHSTRTGHDLHASYLDPRKRRGTGLDRRARAYHFDNSAAGDHHTPGTDTDQPAFGRVL